MNKTRTLTAIFLLTLLVAGMHAVEVAKANPIPWCFNPQMTVTIQSPVSGANCALPLLVSFTAQGDWQFSVSDNVTQDYLRSFFYVLDGQDMRTSGLRFAGTKTTEIHGDPVYHYNFSGQANLTDITGGLHSVTIYYGAVNSVALIGSPDEMIVYNPDWSATSQFYVKIETPAPSPSPSPSLLTIDLANGNYMSSVAVGQSVYFSAVVSNGVPPYRYQWYYRPYYVGTVIGDVYPIGDEMQGATSQNFTFIGNSTGHYLISIEAWDSEGAEGYFMSLPPGIWVKVEGSTPALSPTTSPSPSPSVPEFPTWIVIPLVLVATLLIVFKRKGKRP